MKNRVDRLNSLLKQVISEVITREVRNPRVNALITITKVETSKDLHHARVFISVIGNTQEKQQTIDALQSAAGFIAISASKKVTLRYFPELAFKLDTTVEQQHRIDELLERIHEEQKHRTSP